jgi:hypothetical protein
MARDVSSIVDMMLNSSSREQQPIKQCPLEANSYRPVSGQLSDVSHLIFGWLLIAVKPLSVRQATEAAHQHQKKAQTDSLPIKAKQTCT